jgi:acyl-CoA thioesterase-2
MSVSVTSFEEMFAGEDIGADRFKFHGPATKWRRVFGGLVISQALSACNRTVTSAKRAHSLHAYFLQPGNPVEPIVCEVRRLRDGRSFSVRDCRAMQGDQVIFTLTASYHAEETGLEHFDPAPAVAQPESLLNLAELQSKFQSQQSRRIFEYCTEFMPLDIRPVDVARYFPTIGGSRPEYAQAVWFKANSTLGDSQALHQEVLAYASDMTLLDAALAPHSRSVTDGGIQPASLDHAIWFHRTVRADSWLLYVQDSPNSSNALGLAIGRVYDRAGNLLATIAQEGLIRLIAK